LGYTSRTNGKGAHAVIQKYPNLRLVVIAGMIALVWICISCMTISTRVHTLTSQKYDEASTEMKNFLEVFIDEKQETVSLISLILSHDLQIQKALLTQNGEGLELQRYVEQFKGNAFLQNVWIQVITPEGKSLYRSWTDKKGDDLAAVRLDVAQMLKEPKPFNAISIGKFDLTSKSMIPLYHEGKFIGIVETISKFTSIALKTKEKGFDTLVLVDKAYKKQLEFTYSGHFVGDFYMANTTVKKELVDFVKQKGVEYFINTKGYALAEEINQLITVFKLNDIAGKPMSYFLLFYDLEAIDLSSVERLRDKLILIDIMILLLLVGSFYYLYVKRYRNFIDKLNTQLEYEVTLKTIELAEQNKKLNHLAHHDVLTALPNRLLFLDRLEQSIKLAKRQGTQVSILFLDLDRFKEINDTYGHEVGDKLLIEITHRLEACVRQYDTIARLGGDEFTIIIEDSENDRIVEILEEVIEQMKEPFMINGTMLYSTFSIGVSRYPEDGESTEILLRNADTAMYKAKEHGRNTFAFYDEAMSAQAFKRVGMETDLRGALRNGGFEAYYQPKINAHSGKVVGMEALIRWHHEKLGLISPAEFISLAEEIGLIEKIDKWMMQETMQTALAWQKEGLNIGKLSVNISVNEMDDQHFVASVKEMLEKTGFDPKGFELEITESQIMKNPHAVIGMLHELRALGVSIAIDDFGTGHSSLSLLKNMPIDQLKIDKIFIQDVPQNEEDVAIIKAIIVLAQSLKLELIAEGVETKEQKDFLLVAGCETIQGYYYAKPMSAEDFRAFLLEHS
jgi:diguanylate cyclase (GGDEF)-like protein